MACHIMMLNFSRKGKVKIIFFITKKHIIGLVLLMEKIRMYRECEGRIKKSVQRIAVRLQEVCRVMTDGDPEGRIFLS